MTTDLVEVMRVEPDGTVYVLGVRAGVAPRYVEVAMASASRATRYFQELVLYQPEHYTGRPRPLRAKREKTSAEGLVIRMTDKGGHNSTGRWVSPTTVVKMLEAWAQTVLDERRRPLQRLFRVKKLN